MQEVHVETNQGSAFGYVAEVTDEQIRNFFVNRDVVGSEPLIERLVQQGRPVAFLCNLAVQEAARGTGVGSTLLTDFQEQVYLLDAQLIVLICDNSEDQAEGFDLQAWYESFGFEVQALEGQSEQFPVMILDGESHC